MKELVAEILLRLCRVAAATIIGLIAYLIAIGALGAPPTVELWLLGWLCGAATVLLLESSPI